MGNYSINIYEINTIVKKVIKEIGFSREQILQIVDNVKKEEENLEIELSSVRDKINKIIKDVDELKKQDKLMRQKLADVSKNFHIYGEEDIKNAYDKASEVRIKYFTRLNDEKVLREKRSSLELSLKKMVENIESAEKVMYQISVALSYLEGDILSRLEDADMNSEMFIGIKILEAQEDERKRIARDIHDGPAQHMANVVMKVDICKRILQNDLEEGLKELDDLKASVKVALKEVRGIIFDLRPMSLDDLGLNQTIEENAKKIIQESHIDIQLKLKPMKPEVESIIQVAVYRIIQEVFNNIKKHSQAKHVEMRLDFGTKYLMLIISDDGIGFDVEETIKQVKTRGYSYGLIGILDRVNQLQGEIDIRSSSGTGTTYTVKLPINREVLKDENRGK